VESTLGEEGVGLGGEDEIFLLRGLWRKRGGRKTKERKGKERKEERERE